MIDPEKALALIRERIVPKKPVRLPLAEAAGCILAESVQADRDFPPFDRSMMDGVAVRLADAGSRVRLAGEIAAGCKPEGRVEAGSCVAVMTGAACPPGAEAVVPREKTVTSGQWVTLPPGIETDWNVVRKGSECARGASILEAGRLLTPLASAAAAAAGCSRPLVIPSPTIALITTGREVVDSGSLPEPHQIRDANGPMLEAQAAALGASVSLRCHADDTEESLSRALDRAGDADITLLVGGVSMGKYDLVPEQIERYGAEFVFRKVDQKPGKPLLFAEKAGRLIFGIPGNPLAAHFCFHRYVAAAVRCFAGRDPGEVTMEGVLTEPVGAGKRRISFLLGAASRGEGEWKVEPVRIVSTADLSTASRANCYIHLRNDGKRIEAGEIVEFTLMGGEGWTT